MAINGSHDGGRSMPTQFGTLKPGAKQDWETPKWLFDELNREYGPFDLDPCANEINHKCLRWFGESPAGGGLNELWLGRVYMNPPYGRGVSKWMRHAYECSRLGAKVCCLVPASVCTAWWHDWVEGKAKYKFWRGRIKFVGAKWTAMFPVAVVLYGYDS